MELILLAKFFLLGIVIAFVVALTIITIVLTKKILCFIDKLSSLVEGVNESNKELQKIISQSYDNSLKLNNILSDMESVSDNTKQTLIKVNDKVDNASNLIIAPLSKILMFGVYFKQGLNLIKKIKRR